MGPFPYKARRSNCDSCTVYETTYCFYDKAGAKELGLVLSGIHDDPVKANLECLETLTAFAKTSNIPDGEYRVTRSQDCICLEANWRCCWDEGIVTIRDEAVVNAPDGFTLPF